MPQPWVAAGCASAHRKSPDVPPNWLASLWHTQCPCGGCDTALARASLTGSGLNSCVYFALICLPLMPYPLAYILTEAEKAIFGGKITIQLGHMA